MCIPIKYGWLHTQKLEIGYDETCLPIAMLKSIQNMLEIIAYYDYKIWQMDLKTTFLNGNLIKDVYMAQPNDFILDRQVNKLYK